MLAGNQVIYSTHSPAFLNVTRMDELVFVERLPGTGTHALQPEPVSANEDFRVMTEFDAARSELLLAHAVVLVEGLTEKLVLPFVFAALGHDVDREAISIVECGGKPNIPLFARICKPPQTRARLEGVRRARRRRDAAAARARRRAHDVVRPSGRGRPVNDHSRHGAARAAGEHRHDLHGAATVRRTRSAIPPGAARSHQSARWYAAFSIAAGVSLYELARHMGTSVEQIDRTYGHLLPDALERAPVALDVFVAENEAARNRAVRE